MNFFSYPNLSRLLTLTLVGCALFFVSECQQNSIPEADAEKKASGPVEVNNIYPPSKVDMSLVKVSEHVYYTQGKAGIATDNEGFISNAAVIITDEGIVLVDALGSPSLAELLRTKIREISAQPIVKVIATHYHADHIYGLQVFKDDGAELLAPAGYLEYLDAPIAEERLEERRVSLAPWVNENTRLVRPDVVIDTSTTMKIGDVELGIDFLGSAHSDGDQTVLVKNDAVLISGDLIFEGRIPFTGSGDTANWLATLERFDETGLKALIPGHGPAAEQPAEAIKLTLNYLKKVRTAMQAGVDELLPFDEIYDATDWSEFSHLPAFEATHRPNAYGVYLSIEQESLNQLTQ